MIIGVLGDTHDVDEKIIAQVTKDLIARGAEVFIHTGDIKREHCKVELFGNLPVVCALTKHERLDPAFTFPPLGWAYTRPGNSLITMPTSEDSSNSELRDSIGTRLAIANRLVNIEGIVVYIGHERSYDVMANADRFNEFIGLVNLIEDGINYVFTGHSHRQFLIQREGVSWINPGSVRPDIIRDHAYALVDTETGEIIFTRIPCTKSDYCPATIGILSDVGNISDRDTSFWQSLKEEFNKRDVSVVIIDGDILDKDIGRPELAEFQVYYSPLPEQNANGLDNWHAVYPDNPIIQICNNNFLIRHSLGIDLYGKTEIEMMELVRAESKKYSHVDIVVCGGIHNALFEEHSELMIINPGDARNHRKFATVCFRPHCEITFSEVKQ